MEDSYDDLNQQGYSKQQQRNLYAENQQD